MTSYSAASAVHKTLTAATVDMVTLTGNDGPIEVVNRGSSDPLYVTVGLDTAVPSAPTVEGNDTFIVPAGAVRTIPVTGASTGTDFVVKLIAATAVAYSVRAGGL